MSISDIDFDDVSGKPGHRWEHELTHELAHHVSHRLPVGEAWLLLHEFDSGGLIPDLLAVRLDLPRLAARTDLGVDRPLRVRELELLRLLRSDRWCSFSTCVAQLRTTAGTARRTVRDLEAIGLVENEDSRLRRTKPIGSVISRIISFESKLRSWRKALVQARGHRHFAHQSWVAIDRPTAAEHAAAFARAGVGLMESSGAGAFQSVVPAKVGHRPTPLSRLRVSELVFAALRGVHLRKLPEARLPGGAARCADRELPRLFGLPSKTLPPGLRVA